MNYVRAPGGQTKSTHEKCARYDKDLFTLDYMAGARTSWVFLGKVLLFSYVRTITTPTV